jgi:hypothetical protein
MKQDSPVSTRIGPKSSTKRHLLVKRLDLGHYCDHEMEPSGDAEPCQRTCSTA